MKTTGIKRSARAMTLLEVALVIFVLFLVAGVVLPVLLKAKSRRPRIAYCTSNLKQVGLAMRMWANDHGEKFPWSVSTNQGGTMEFANTAEVFRHFLAISNELSSPRVLRCGNDEKRTMASSWDQLTNDARHVSYFVGLDADETKPQSILSGDRHVTTNGMPALGAAHITLSTAASWSRELHGGFGSLVMGDGGAYHMKGPEMGRQCSNYLANWGASSIRLVIP